MKRQHIALMGRARSGKDTVAARLVTAHGYTRVAFADPLKDVALALDPIVGISGFGQQQRLSGFVQRCGWEWAKDQLPEVRRTLQRLGQSIRDRDPDYWLRLALLKVDVLKAHELPCVITDVRYPNEAEALTARGFKLVRVIRPNIAQQVIGLHESETALDAHPADALVSNTGTPADLEALADTLP